jgi:superfamily I DNA/RNA helicase
VELERKRAAYSDAIVNSGHDKRLIVAGPGTGKSFTFERALAVALANSDGEKGLALTFIRNLVADLKKELREVAAVFTFHGFCNHLMHRYNVAGLGEGDYYPPLLKLVVGDIDAIQGRRIETSEIEALLHNLDERGGVIGDTLARTDYYGAVSHTDLVYRVLRHFEVHQESIPSYPLVVVDEYQDFSLLETSFIALLASKSRVLIAGDDDQALYGFKEASPEFIRVLAASPDHLRFPLPYCSRCTEVVVAAVNDVIASATATGHLERRVDKDFLCYLPDKQADSLAHPRIVHVRCSSANEPYVGQYIAQQIARIPAEDIAVSREKGYPTALVVGPNPFLRRAFDVVYARFPQARMKTSTAVEVALLDGYRRIAAHDRSRLGWRIVVECRPFDGRKEVLHGLLESEAELAERLPAEYANEHRGFAKLVGILLEGGKLSDEQEAKLCAVLELPLQRIQALLANDDPDAESEEVPVPGDTPDILFTSLVGSKGLSAEHVFVVGLNNGHFPRKVAAITDDEICQFVVALSRTRKRCHVVSCKWFGKGPLQESVFLGWIRRHVAPITVDRTYDFAD